MVLEAQAAGLEVVCSEFVPEEASFLPTTSVLPIGAGAREWAKHILQLSQPHATPKDMSDVICAAGYDISNVAQKVYKSYTASAASGG